MISKFSLIGCFFCFLLLAKSSFASEIKLVFANEIPIIITAKLLKDEVVLDSTNFEAQKGESMVLESPLSGIHCISFDQKGSFYFYITNSLNLEVNVDVMEGLDSVVIALSFELIIEDELVSLISCGAELVEGLLVQRFLIFRAFRAPFWVWGGAAFRPPCIRVSLALSPFARLLFRRRLVSHFLSPNFCPNGFLRAERRSYLYRHGRPPPRSGVPIA